MAKLFLVNIDMHGNEIQNVVLQPLATAPSNPTVGRIYYDTTESMLKTYDGTRWSSVGAVVSVNGQAGAVVLTQDDVANGSTYVRTHNDLTDALVALINGALQKSGGTMSGAIAMGSNKITGLANGTAATDAAAFGQIPVATTTSPKMNGTAAVGSETKWAKGDHVHPTDTSRQAKITASGILKGNGSGGVSAAVAGTDYALPSAIPEAYTSNPAMDGTASAGSSTKWAKGDHVHPTDTSRMAASLKGAANGVAELDANGKIPASQIPDSFDEVVFAYYHGSKFYEDSAHTIEITGETNKLYVDREEASQGIYYWNATKSSYCLVGSTILLGETAVRAYRGDRGKIAYDHSQLTSGNPHNVTKADVGLGNVDNKSEATIKSDFTGSVASGNDGFVTGDAVNSALSLSYQALQGQIPSAYTSNPAMDGTASPGTTSQYAKGNHVHPTDTSRMAANLKGAANGVAELDANGKVPSSQLPAYVDDVIEGYYYNSKFYKEAAHTTEIAGETGKIYVDLSTEKTYRWSGTAFVEISASLALGETSSTAYRGDRGKTAYDHSQLTSGNPHNVTKSDVGLSNVDNTSDATKKTNFTGSIASGNTGFVTGGDVYTALIYKEHVSSGYASIDTSSTSCSITVPSGGHLIATLAVQNDVKVETDVSFGNNGVITFSVSSNPSSPINCFVVYYS